MASMNVSVPDPMRDWVQSRIESGQYASVSDYMRELIRKDQAATAERWLSALDASVTLGVEETQAGRTKPAEEVFDRLSAKYAAMARARQTP